MTTLSSTQSDQQQNTSDRNCPHCSTAMTTITYEGIDIESCDQCNGKFLDADELGKIIQIREVKFDPAELDAISHATPITGLLALDKRELTCPKCAKPMTLLNYGNDSGIIIDRCTACNGFWLDDGELEKVQMVVEGWDHRLPEVMEQHAPKLREIAVANEHIGKAHTCNLPLIGPFINAIINGIIDLTP